MRRRSGHVLTHLGGARPAAFLGALLLAGCSANEPVPTPTSPPRDEAGFIDVEPVTYAIRHGTERTELTSSAARLWYTFQAADASVPEAPLAVFWNGGPGAASEILFAYNTARRSLDPAGSGQNPASWTRFANLLYVDARGTGFSYGRVAGVADPATREAEFGVKNFNPWIDGADFVRVVLRFLHAHPSLERRPVVLVAESYGGIRASVFLELLLHYRSHDDGSASYEDPALVREVQAHLDLTLGGAPGAAAQPGAVASQFGRLVLLQPRLSTPYQQAAAGAALEGAESPLIEVAAQTGTPFVPCSAKPAPCTPFDNAISFLQVVGRDVYDVREPAGATFARYDAIAPALSSPESLSAALGVDVTSIDDLGAARRKDGYRIVAASAETEPLGGVLGALAPWDRYFRVELFDAIGAPFASTEAQGLGLDRRDARWGTLFLEDLRYVRTFVTQAAQDALIYTPALPEALAMYGDLVTEVSREAAPAGEARPGQLRVRFVDGEERLVRFPRYDAAGHSVTFHQAMDLARDVGRWLEEP